MIVDWEASAYVLGEKPVSVEELCLDTGRDFGRVIARTGFSSLRRTEKKPEDFFADFLREHLVANRNDLLIFVSQSSDQPIPGIAPRVLARTGRDVEFRLLEVSDGCAGFVRAVLIADAVIEAGQAEGVTIVCGEVYSRFIAPESTSGPIFSDAISQIRLVRGSGRAVLGRSELSNFGDGGMISAGAKESPEFEMNGPGVLQWATASAQLLRQDLESQTGFSLGDVSHWYLHQGSKIVVDGVGQSLGLDVGGLFRAGGYGNTASSSIPIALVDDYSKGFRMERIGMVGFGIGLSMIGTVMDIT